MKTESFCLNGLPVPNFWLSYYYERVILGLGLWLGLGLGLGLGFVLGLWFGLGLGLGSYQTF